MDLLIIIALALSATFLINMKRRWMALVLTLLGSLALWAALLTGAGHPPFDALSPWELAQMVLVSSACFLFVWFLVTVLSKLKHSGAR
jgi:hypothetical protein